MKQIGVLLVICVVITASVAMATVRHVPSKYPTIQAGIDAAVEGDTVLVADGTYKGDGNRDIDFKGKAIMVTSENGPENCIIDCEGSSSDPHRGFYFHTREDSNAVIKGFTITNGYADDGGGICCYNRSSPAVEGNTISNNNADGNGGGGIYCDHSSPTIKGNTITDNNAYYYGGGINCHNYSTPAIRGNIIARNSAETEVGGGIYCGYYSSPTIEDNTIADNNADSYGGGGIICYTSSPTIRGNTITGNSTRYYGGGIYCYYSSSPTIEDNAITGNSTQYYGGGIHCHNYSSPSIRGNTITGNTAEKGGGIYCDYSFPTIEGSTVTDNTAEVGGGIYCGGYQSSPTVLNSILWADSAGVGQEIYLDENTSITITYSDIEGGWEGEGNIAVDPIFVLHEHRDYRLLWGSPCIDSGHPDSLDPDGTRSDMGAFPFDQSKPLTVYLTPDTTLIPLHGELGVTYTLINIEPDPWTFWLRSDVTLPNGKPYPGNPIIGPKKVTLPGNKNVQRRISHPIPGAAPLGIYTYKSRIGIPPDQLIDEDSFDFEVVGQ
jgi:parallel beta-helix repeat protein